ncbi:hypothetical protein IWZ03DRAFT_200979 [Phyllosticta citriasiana]|uniref:Uncharacterized protein n=1 Tax=Phyllosticta citriasiana TaxID=595635 RepID=A0ABR1KIP9_9PEZI
MASVAVASVALVVLAGLLLVASIIIVASVVVLVRIARIAVVAVTTFVIVVAAATAAGATLASVVAAKLVVLFPGNSHHQLLTKHNDVPHRLLSTLDDLSTAEPGPLHLLVPLLGLLRLGVDTINVALPAGFGQFVLRLGNKLICLACILSQLGVNFLVLVELVLGALHEPLGLQLRLLELALDVFAHLAQQLFPRSEPVIRGLVRGRGALELCCFLGDLSVQILHHGDVAAMGVRGGRLGVGPFGIGSQGDGIMFDATRHVAVEMCRWGLLIKTAWNVGRGGFGSRPCYLRLQCLGGNRVRRRSLGCVGVNDGCAAVESHRWTCRRKQTRTFGGLTKKQHPGANQSAAVTANRAVITASSHPTAVVHSTTSPREHSSTRSIKNAAQERPPG